MKTKARKRRKHQRKTDGYWSADHGLGEWTPEDKREVEKRTAELLATKLKPPERITNVPLGRHSAAIYTRVGSAAPRRGGFPVSRDY